MEFGMKLPHSGALAGVDGIKRVAVEAEDLGYNSVWTHDHVTYDTDWFVHRSSGLIEQCQGKEPDFYESLSVLTYVAGFTERVKLGISILVLPLRDPRVFARQAITTQALSGGRLILGVGVGDYPRDFQVMGIPYKDRVAYTEEYVAALNALFQCGYVSFQGPTISFQNAAMFPKVPPIPVYMGGGLAYRSKTDSFELFHPTLRRTARWCTGWLPEGPPQVVADGAKVIKQIAHEYGRGEVDFETIPNLPMFLGDDSISQEKVRQSIDAKGMPMNQALTKCLIGSVATISRVLDEYQKAGVSNVTIQCWAEDLDSFVSMMRTFSREVMPSFR